MADRRQIGTRMTTASARATERSWSRATTSGGSGPSPPSTWARLSLYLARRGDDLKLHGARRLARGEQHRERELREHHLVGERVQRAAPHLLRIEPPELAHTVPVGPDPAQQVERRASIDAQAAPKEHALIARLPGAHPACSLRAGGRSRQGAARSISGRRRGRQGPRRRGEPISPQGRSILGNLRRRRELVDPMIGPAGVDDRHRAGVVRHFLFMSGQPRVDFVAPNAPRHIDRGVRIAARRDRPQHLSES